MASTRLPASFTSVYRLFLRTCSASVLHHGGAKRNLRLLWRPVFAAAARNLRDLQTGRLDTASQDTKEAWLRTWEQRIDNTLALLYTSCKSRGLPHGITRNLSLLVTSERTRILASARKAWVPHLPPTSPQYHPPQLTQKVLKRMEDSNRIETFKATAWDPLKEVVRMAEGRDGISLGRMKIQRRIWWRRKMKVFPQP
ncbi:hypothetical protein BDZ94DRAFT_1261225 [Collybia nuda]|uniref:Uncharacterized protein n=1 Tax=Collybia nuda TaxID=64659 RepID=A0A9P5Y315_9AGAR|nr:hypothetical protein BDZ94DRAFT_1261225 [Collybia nuda]